ncbi:MAG: carbohydrate ABC transporter permease [Lachnospiraceae bacterium]|nr:carbohydrate ABC transporter permease [Lachnospiraceae bacterium]
MKKKKTKIRGQVALHILFLLMTIAYIVPFLLMISVSFTDETALIVNGYKLIPSKFSTEAYEMVFNDPTQILNSYRTTIIFSAISTFLAVLIMGVMAYPMSRPGYRHNRFISLYVLFTMLFSAGMVPSYLLIVKYLHLNNTMWVYILPGLVSAYNLIVIRTNYKSLPSELIEAAKIDGAGELYICFKIVMPLSKPVLASIGFLFLVGKWNNWMTSMLYITKPSLYSLQYLLQKILQEAEFLKQMAQSGILEAGEVFPTESYRYAMALVAAGPVLCVFPFFQKYFAKGLTLGGVKG